MKIIYKYLVVLLVFGFIPKVEGKVFTLKSPDKTIQVKVDLTNEIAYSVWIDGNQVLKPSPLSMTLADGRVLGVNPKLKSKSQQHIDRIVYPVVWQKSKEIAEQANELRLVFDGDYAVVFRAYDEGVAYRFETSMGGEIIVENESVNYMFAENYPIYFPEETSFFSHNERSYLKLTLDSISSDRFCSLPTLLGNPDGPKLLITETALLDYPGLWLKGNGPNTLTGTLPPYALEQAVDHVRWSDDRSVVVSQAADFIAKTEGTRSFPWRILAVAKEDKDLLANQLTYLLAEPSKLDDSSWIKPGKVAWDWWNYNNIYGVDFRAGINTETYKYYIDFASAHGLEYIILDEGWYVLGDLLDVVPDIDMEELVAYGKQKNVELILWVVWKTLDDQLDAALDQFRDWGVKGIKVDFMQRDDQWMVNYYERIAKEAAERQLLVDFHGSYKPSGLRRTYPNVMTREGVKGLEHNKWSDVITPEHNLTLPFIRMVAGPMDYTPGAMINANPDNFSDVFNRPMSMGTRCHQMAMFVIYESPLQMLADNPSNYYKEPACTQFISRIPTVWEETVVLDGVVGDYLAMARKYEDEWFVGVMTDENVRAMALDFSFLPEGKYQIEIFKDGINADRYASDFATETMEIDAGAKLNINLAAGGGWVAKVSKL